MATKPLHTKPSQLINNVISIISLLLLFSLILALNSKYLCKPISGLTTEVRYIDCPKNGLEKCKVVSHSI